MRNVDKMNVSETMPVIRLDGEESIECFIEIAVVDVTLSCDFTSFVKSMISF